MDKIRILVIDDEKIITESMTDFLEDEGYIVETASNGEEGIRKVKENKYDIIFLDLKLPDKDGIDVLKELKAIRLEVSVIIITGYATVETASNSIRLSAYDYILKPLQPQQIRQALKTALRRKEAENEIFKSTPQPRLLFIGIEEALMNKIHERFKAGATHIMSVRNADMAIQLLKKDNTINVIIHDIDGVSFEKNIDFLKSARKINPEIIYIPFTFQPDVEEAVLFMKEGSYDYLVKPVKIEKVAQLLEHAWYQQNLNFLNKQLIYKLHKTNEELEITNEKLKLEIVEKEKARNAEDEAKISLKEREILLIEIHHRVRNNLQIISNILEFQEQLSDSSVVKTVFRDARSRLKTMALIHEKLYATGTLSKIDYDIYLKDLIKSLYKSFSTGRITFNVEASGFFLETDKAIRCALIINELVTNAIKYAFPSGESGKISIKCSTDSEQNATIIVSDNGIGLPEDIYLTESLTMGFTIANGFIQQLKGSIEIKRDKGTTYIIRFNISS